MQMANLFSQIDHDRNELSHKNYISREEYIKTIIEMNNKDSEALSPDLKIFFLKLLTRSITEKNSNDRAGVPVDEWEATYWDSQEKAIEKEQQKMVNCSLANFLCQLLSEGDITDNINLANEILVCGIAFLLGGYTESQNSILKILREDEDNKVLENIYKLIKKLGDLIYKNNKKKRISSNNTNRTFETNRCDNYDHYDIQMKCVVRMNVYEPDNAKEEEYKITCVTTFRRAFKFIQLLCENNNVVGKNFIREQKIKDGPKKLNSINFIQLATNELRQMFKIFCSEIMDIPIFILDFILEVTQIPVKENQLVLMRSTFFEDLCAMEDRFSKEENLRERDIKEEGINALANIYQKSVKIILSSFEGDDNDTFTLLDDKLESKFLINILDRLLKSEKLIHLKALKERLKSSKNEEFQERILEIIDILMIFKKMEEKIPLRKSKLVESFNDYKASLNEPVHLHRTAEEIAHNDSFDTHNSLILDNSSSKPLL